MVEFVTLSNAVGGDGNTLKEFGQGSGGGAGTNTSGFSVLLTGYRYFDGNFYEFGNFANIWSSTEYSSLYSYYLYLSNSNSIINLIYGSKTIGMNVRCLKD